MRARTRNLYPTTVHFRRESPVLSVDGAKEVLEIAQRLEKTAIDSNTKVYVFGYAPDIADPNKKIMIAARRAQSVEFLLRKTLAQQLHSPDWIRSVGGSANNRLSAGFNTDPENQQIVIAVIEE